MNPAVTDPKFVVVGTGRHGSGYIAQLLTACGIPTGHEQFYGFNQGSGDLVGESSWMAVPHLEEIAAKGIPIFHQVRHPEDTLRSMLGGEMFGEGRKNKWFKVREKFLPMTGDDVTDAMRIYVTWNLACERWATPLTERPPTLRFRIEDQVNHWTVGRMAVLAGLASGTDVGIIDEAFVSTSRTVNHHARHPSFTLDDLPKTADRDALMFMGERYGYL